MYFLFLKETCYNELGGNMIYVFYGLESYLIQKEVLKIWNQFELSGFGINQYDMETGNMKEVLEDAMTPSMFSLKKGILCENASFLTGSSKLEEDSTLFEEYLDHPNPDTILIFTIDSEKLDERKKIVKKLHKVGIVKSFLKNETSEISLIKNFFDGYHISSSDLTLFQNRVGNDLRLLETEAEKLKNYATDTKEIKREDILSLTSKNVDVDIFKLIENIIEKRKEETFEIYSEMLKRNEEPIKILVMLANQFRIMYQAKVLLRKGYTEKDIASTLNIHPYRVKLALQKSRPYKEELLLSYLDQLADLDVQIKEGNIEKELGLELFLLAL